MVIPKFPILYCFAVLAVFSSVASGQEIIPYDTTQPNEFYFTSDIYYVDEDATNAVIEVGFVPGDRSYSGSVNYSTGNGTALSGPDYIGVTNILAFSGPAPTKTFNIPIKTDALIEGDETVQLFLSSENALITRGSATLVIVDKTTPPKLGVQRTNSTLTLWWPTNVANGELQKATTLTSTNWVTVSTAPTVSNGRYNVTTQIGGTDFFRLKWAPPAANTQ